MAKIKKVKISSSILALIAVCFLFFTPFLLNPNILSQKDNDLGRTYIPLYTFSKNSFLTYKSIPLWRGDQMMGEPLISNPLPSLLYPANVLFLLMPASLSSVIYYFLHFLLGAISTFYLARSFGFKKIQAFAAGLFYVFSTKILLHLSAGHITMVAAFAYFPLAFLSIRNLLTKPTFKWVIIGSLSLAFMLILYATIFYYAGLFFIFYSLYYYLSHKYAFSANKLKSKAPALFVCVLLVLAFSAVELVPQIMFGPLSTRPSLTFQDVALPLFNTKRYLESLLFPYLDFNNFDHESFLYLGIVPSLLAVWGFLNLSIGKKILIGIFGIFTLLFTLGASTPVFEFLYQILPLLKYNRETTRIWFVVALIVALLAAYALKNIKNNKVVYLLIILFLAENFLISYLKINSIPNLKNNNLALYKYLASDKDIFRVYCTTYCFNPQLLQKYHLQILNGESPIQQKGFTDFLQKAGSYKWSKFAVIFPPYQIWQVTNPPQPSPTLLGKANVKYVASTYVLKDSNFNIVGKFDKIYLYQNQSFLKRAYFENSKTEAKIQRYEPNRIIISFGKADSSRRLIFSENYIPGWVAIENSISYKVEPYLNVFRSVIIQPGTTSVEFIYHPQGFAAGKTITFATIVFLLIFFWYTRKKQLLWPK